jgi:hypothetical protein
VPLSVDVSLAGAGRTQIGLSIFQMADLTFGLVFFNEKERSVLCNKK